MNVHDTASFPALSPELLTEEKTTPPVPPEKPEEKPPARRVPPTIRALRHRDFRMLWMGAFTSSTGTWMQTVAQSWLVFTITGSAFWLGVDSFLALAPSLMFTLIGGVAADRIERRRLLLASQYTQMAYAFTLATLVYTGKVEIWHILILSFMTGTSQAFGGPAYMSLLPNLVESEDIPNAIALNSIQFNLARVIGPTIAGVAFVKFGATVCFALNGLSFLAVIFSLHRLQFIAVASPSKDSLIEGLRQGFAYIQHHRVILLIFATSFSMAFLGVAMMTLLPVFTKQVFHGDAKIYSRLLACSGVGAVSGALLVATFSQMKNRGQVMLIALTVFGSLGVAFACSRSLWLSLGLVFLTGMSMVTVFSQLTSLIQAKLTDNIRGRVMSMYMLTFNGGMAFGGFTAGAMAQRFSPTLTLAVEASLLALIGLTALVSRSELSKL